MSKTALPPPGAADVLYVVDLSTWLYRSFHATPMFYGANRQPANAVKGGVNLLHKLLYDQRPSYLAFGVDGGGRTFRHDLFPGYKADRKPRPDELSPQIDVVLDILKLHEVPLIALEGFEADDLIATATKQAVDAGKRVVIVALDKDLHQLVRSDRVMLWDLKDKCTGPPEVRDRWGVGPEHLVDMMGLIGDPTDGIPGVSGVGKKTAAELIARHGSLDAALAHAAEEKKPALRKRLSEGGDAARMSRELVRLRADLPVVVDFEQARPGFSNAAPILDIYREYGFGDLLAKVQPFPKRG